VMLQPPARASARHALCYSSPHVQARVTPCDAAAARTCRRASRLVMLQPPACAGERHALCGSRPCVWARFMRCGAAVRARGRALCCSRPRVWVCVLPDAAAAASVWSVSCHALQPSTPPPPSPPTGPHGRPRQRGVGVPCRVRLPAAALGAAALRPRGGPSQRRLHCHVGQVGGGCAAARRADHVGGRAVGWAHVGGSARRPAAASTACTCPSPRGWSGWRRWAGGGGCCCGCGCSRQRRSGQTQGGCDERRGGWQRGRAGRRAGGGG
jgi:hypothetical protein